MPVFQAGFPRRPVWRLAVGVIAVALLARVGDAVAASGEGDGAAACVPVASWLDPETQRTIGGGVLIDRLADAPAVLLGETHTAAEDHRWQLDTLAQLYAHNRNMVIAFEAFPRRVQPSLDRWAAGTMSEEEFLDAVEWDQVWGYPARHYLPLFHFARRHRLPMLAMNVDRSLISRVGRDGWGAIPEAERRGIGDPAPAPAAYRERLERTLGMHAGESEGREGGEGSGDAAAARQRRDRFIEAQLTWDRAMAEVIAKAHRAGGAPLVVGIVGRGHLEYGHGIPHQLRDLGIDGAASLLTWPENRGCGDLIGAEGHAIADAVFGIDHLAEPEGSGADKPRLGVMIGDADDGVRIERVLDGSVADAAGLEAGDVVLRAAGRAMTGAADLQEVVQGMLPGTVLPLDVRRDGNRLSIEARFPPPGDDAKR